MKSLNDTWDYVVVIGAGIILFFSSLWLRDYSISTELYSSRIIWVTASVFIITAAYSWSYMKFAEENKQEISLTNYGATLIAYFGLSGIVFVVLSLIFD